jgi:hypothetical protein
VGLPNEQPHVLVIIGADFFHPGQLRSLGRRTSICNSARRAGNSSLPRLGCRLELRHGRVPNTVHSFFVRFESGSARGGQYLMSTSRSIGHQLPAYVGVDSSLSLGHSAWLTPWIARGSYLERHGALGGTSIKRPMRPSVSAESSDFLTPAVERPSEAMVTRFLKLIGSVVVAVAADTPQGTGGVAAEIVKCGARSARATQPVGPRVPQARFALRFRARFGLMQCSAGTSSAGLARGQRTNNAQPQT